MGRVCAIFAMVTWVIPTAGSSKGNQTSSSSVVCRVKTSTYLCLQHLNRLNIIVFSMADQIDFLKEPNNVTVFEGNAAFFPCTFVGINVAPRWRINNEMFVTSALPRGYSYNRSGLVISSVDLSLNMTSYSCFFSVYQGGRFMDIESTTGYLIIAGLHIPQYNYSIH